MDLLTFVSKIINSLAWPITSIVFVIIFKEPIIRLLENIKNLRYNREKKELEVNFIKEVKQVSSKVDEKLPRREIEELPTKAKDFTNVYFTLEVSPRQAIVEAWMHLEVEAVLALGRHGHWREGERAAVNQYTITNALKEKGLLNSDQLVLFNQLRVLRNNVLHRISFPVNERIALEYIKTTEKLFNYVKEL